MRLQIKNNLWFSTILFFWWHKHIFMLLFLLFCIYDNALLLLLLLLLLLEWSSGVLTHLLCLLKNHIRFLWHYLHTKGFIARQTSNWWTFEYKSLFCSQLSKNLSSYICLRFYIVYIESKVAIIINLKKYFCIDRWDFWIFLWKELNLRSRSNIYFI